MKRILLLSLILLTKTLFAQVPVNDECANATLLTPAASCNSIAGTLSNATTSTVTTGCGGYADVFYKFVATSTSVDISLLTSASLDPKLSVMSACGTSSSLYCVDNGNTGDSELAYVNNLIVGTTYYIKVANYSSTIPASPTFSICVKTVVRPSNDECAGAITLTPGSTCNVTTGTFLQASTSTTTGGCGGAYDVFYKFVATSSSTSITATPSTGTDVRYALLTSCSGSALVCVNNAASGIAESQIIDNLTVGTTYYIKLSTGSTIVPVNPAFTICVQNQPVPAAPSNNECSVAATLVQSSTCSATPGSLLGATTSTITPSCFGYKDVFYKFVATATTANIEVASSAGLDAVVSVHNACGGPSLFCTSNASAGGVDKVIVGSLVVGTTYYIKVASSDFAPSTNTFTVCVLSVPRPVNDNCSGALSITPSSTCIATNGSMLNASPSTFTSSCSNGYSDVFYKFVASSNAVSIVVDPTSGIDPVIGAYASCGGSSIGCVDAGGSGSNETLTLTGLTIGVTYYIQVQNYGSSVPLTSDFTICVQNVVLVVPANDECVNAILLTPSTSCNSVVGTIENASISTTTPSCQGTKDVFYKFVANSPIATVNVTGASGLDVEIATFSGCGTTALECLDGGGSGGTETISMTGLTVGNTYYIKVQDYSSSGSATAYTFNICVVSNPAIIPPANNECANAITLTPSTICTPTTGTLLNATTSTITSSCEGYYDVFYKFVANATTATVTAVGSAGLDLNLSAFAACGGADIACVDNSWTEGGTETMSLTSLIVGNTYYIKVANYTSAVSTTSTFTICVVSTPTVAPANNECATAITLTPSTTCTPITGTLLNATTSTITPSCAGYYDVFYKFVANATTATVTGVGSAGLDLKLSAFSACGGTNLACVDNNYSQGGTETMALTSLIVGNTYYIKVANYTTASTTYTFTICVVSTPVVAPANNECANAITLTQSTTCTPTTGTIANATTSTITPSCAGYYDVFYKFVANTTSATVTAVGSAGLDLKLSAFAACGGTDIACVDNNVNQGGTEAMALTSLIVGNTYYIKVANYTTVSTTSTFTICVVSTPVVTTPPANDACANAITLTPASTCIPTSGTCVNATNSSVGVDSECLGYGDVFYKFVATASTATVTSVPSGGADVILSVMSSCSSTTSLVCVDNMSTSGATEIASLTGLTIGSTYFVKIQNYWESIPAASSFSVCVTSTPVTTATQSSTALSSISLYPNPTQNVLNIENVSMDTKIELIDLTGKTILVQDLSADTQVDLSNYSAGVYILKLTSGGVSENRRVVLSK